MLIFWPDFCVKMNKKLSASRRLCPADPYQGLCPWILLRALTPDSRYRLELCARHGPTFGKSCRGPIMCLSVHSCFVHVIMSICSLTGVRRILQSAAQTFASLPVSGQSPDDKRIMLRFEAKNSKFSRVQNIKYSPKRNVNSRTIDKYCSPNYCIGLKFLFRILYP